ncbi:MAG: hypothetical protein R3E79_21785 [Caldilineaceae bacterium]
MTLETREDTTTNGTLPDQVPILEDEVIGSFNHGYIQLRLGGLLNRLGSFTPVGELSLDVVALR